jgi:hypothetical protein
MTVKSLTRSSLVNNRWYENMLVGNEAYVPINTGYELLETQIVSGNQNSVVFSNLNSSYGLTYQHLQLRITARTDRTGADSDPIRIRFNSDAGANYGRHRLMAYLGNNVISGGSGGQDSMYITEAAAVSQNAANIFADIITDIIDPFETTKSKTIRSLSGMYASGWQSIELWSGFWNSTNAITTIALSPVVGTNFVSGSRFSLYGMRSS